MMFSSAKVPKKAKKKYLPSLLRESLCHNTAIADTVLFFFLGS